MNVTGVYERSLPPSSGKGWLGSVRLSRRLSQLEETETGGGQVCFALRSPAKRCRSNSHYLAGCFHSSGGRNARKHITMARLETGKKACAALFNHRRFIRGRKKSTVLPLAWTYRSICWLQSTCRLWKLPPFPLCTRAAVHLSYLLSLDTIERK